MPPQPEMPRRPTRRERQAAKKADGSSFTAGRGRIFLGAFLAFAFILLVSLRGIAGFYTDYLWFDSLHLSPVFNRVLATKAILSMVGGLAFFALCWGNLLIAERLAPVFRPSSGDDDLIERYHEVVGRRAWMVRLGVAAFMALVVGVSLGASWNEWILFTNRVDFGQKDAIFHTDVGFYVFQLPFLLAAASWLFSSLLVVFVITVLAHVVNGGIRFHTQLDRVTPQVKAHLSVLLGLLALVQVGRYWLSRYQLTFSTRGTVDGATYTDVNVELRAIKLLMLIALFAIGLFIANIWRRGWVLPVMAVGLWVLVAVLAGGVVPAFVQRFRVEPTESSMERKYIANNIAATQAAYGLSDVESRPFDWTAKDIPPSTLAANAGTLNNVRLWDPKSMQDSYRQKQEVKSFYEINDVDVDRYVIDGKSTQVMIAARDLAADGIKQPSWEATHLAYTHGYGVVAAKANDQSVSGDPVLVAEDIPVKVSDGMPEVKQSAIYFGENKSGYVIVDTKRREINYQDDQNKTTFTTYEGKDGVKIGSGPAGFLRKAAFSLRFGDINPMVSGNIEPQSRVLLERDVTSRLKTVAPFLAYDHDPYVVVNDGHLQYVVDAYTTTRNFPNAQRADTGGLDPASGLYGRSFNYARNSVKAVVDAYDGTVKLYVVDDKDPLIKAYQHAFPELFTPSDKIPDALREHFRYPEDLFTVQTQMWAKYHVSDPDDFYNRSDEWSVPHDSGAFKKSGSTNTPVGPDGQELTGNDKYPSTYQLMQLPGEDKPSFVLQRPYVTSADDSEAGGGQNQLRAFIVADSDPGSYGQLKTYLLPVTDLPDGPNLAAADMRADGDVADKAKSLCTDKRICTFAAPSIVPVGDSLLYVQSFLVAGDKQGAPKIEHVIVNYRRPGVSDVAIDTTLYGALSQLFEGVPTSVQGGDQGTVTDPGTDPTTPSQQPSDKGGTITAQESDLIDQVVADLAAADAAARKGDQVTWAEKVTSASKAAEKLQTLRDEAKKNGTGKGVQEDGGATTTTTAPASTTDPKVTTTTSAGT
ncbi:UPF0182 family protein [Aquihabitans sp. McL0605]|uniref:UPF0182 family membrane protein n=1 Tax=Aquihabitans sp. McL0605 TaxID=3415671 RepID=UPI003CEC9CB4